MSNPATPKDPDLTADYARIDSALAINYPLWKIESGIREDERLTTGHVNTLIAYAREKAAS